MPAISGKKAKKKFIEELRWNAQLAHPGPHQFVVVLDHLKPTFNVGKIFRSAQAFGATAIYMVGMDYFNPFPAQGAVRYVPIKQFSNFEECAKDLTHDGFECIAFDVGPKAESLFETKLPLKAALVLGHESFGLSFSEDSQIKAKFVKIPMFAKIESLNVSIAASIVMYEYVRQHHSKDYSNKS